MVGGWWCSVWAAVGLARCLSLLHENVPATAVGRQPTEGGIFAYAGGIVGAVVRRRRLV